MKNPKRSSFEPHWLYDKTMWRPLCFSGKSTLVPQGYALEVFQSSLEKSIEKTIENHGK